ncbi:MAG TPA: cytochrome c [Bacteroidales bacterium]|nr:cytochrome c [Bacteroidales bacterium]
MKKLLLLSLIALLCVYWINAPLPVGTETDSIEQDGIAQRIERGMDVYSTYCLSCHQANGEGLTGVYPPLAKSDHLSKDQSASIVILLKGQNEEITVNGTKYSLPMAPLNYLTDQQIADVLNYMGNSWGNKFNTVTPAMVKSKRD